MSRGWAYKRETKCMYKVKEQREMRKINPKIDYIARNRNNVINRNALKKATLAKIKSENNWVLRDNKANILKGGSTDSVPSLGSRIPTKLFSNNDQNKPIEVIEIRKRTPSKEKPEKKTNDLIDEAHQADPLCSNHKVYEEYGDKILHSLLRDDRNKRITRFLDNHTEISPKVRARLVDWFVEIVCNFGCHQNTFYLAIKILDNYFNSTKKSVSVRDLHLLGVTSIFIASKLEDLMPFSLEVLYHKIAHQNCSK